MRGRTWDRTAKVRTSGGAGLGTMGRDEQRTERGEVWWDKERDRIRRGNQQVRRVGHQRVEQGRTSNGRGGAE